MGHYEEENAEMWDIYDKNRNLTGKTCKRGSLFQPGDFHMVVHVCILNSKNEMLIQQRQPFKHGWPNMWDITMGGSALSGETSQMAAERELFEEIGLKLDLSNVRPYFTINFNQGFDDYYVLRYDVELSQLIPQKEEVQQLKWAGKEEVLKMKEEGIMIPYYFLEHLFEIEGCYGAREKTQGIVIQFAEETNLSSWMNLIEIVHDNFPGLETKAQMLEYKETVKHFMKEHRAICALDGKMVVGILLFSTKHNMICCMAVHPEYRRKKIATRMVAMMMPLLDATKDITVETFRAEDEKGIAPRAFYQSLGFEQGELSMFEQKYPEQIFRLHSHKA